MKKEQAVEKFNEALLDSIDEALSALGEDAKKSIYIYFEIKFFMAKQDIPKKINDFSRGLEELFGSGAQSLELLIMKNLHKKVGCLYVWNGPNGLFQN